MRTLIALVCALACTAAVAAAGTTPLFAREADDLAREAVLAAKEGKRLAVLFESEGCTFCEQMKRRVFPARQALREFGAAFRTVALRADRATELVAPDGTRTTAAAFAARLRIAGTPAFAFFDGRGALEMRHQGAFPDAAGLAALGRYVSSGAYESLPFAAWRAQAAKGSRTAALQPVSFAGNDICTTNPPSGKHPQESLP